MHIALLDANTDDSAFAARQPSEVAKFAALLAPAAPDMHLQEFRVAEGHFPDAPGAYDGLMVSGSPASVNDADAWVGRLKALIRQAVGEGVPVFGACFGHQAVAAALGGRVGPNPQGWVLGRIESENHSPAPWMAAAPARMALHAAHNEQVLELPEGARLLGGSPGCKVGQVALGEHVFTTQYHPEITRDFMEELLDELAGKVPDVVLGEARSGLDGPEHSALMARCISDFFARARR